MATTFHSRTGSCVILSNGGKTACRNHPSQEFNNGIVFSFSPLQPNKLFEILIEKKVNTWSGSVEVGVVSCDPATIDLPTSAGQLRDGAWIMSGSSIIRNGQTVLEDYGASLDLLSEGDKVGVMLTPSGSLHFFINGVDQGSAFDDIPSVVYGVVDLYGKCSQVSLVDSAECNLYPIMIGESPVLQLTEHLAFHEHCGLLIRLSNGNRTAERRSPMDEFNNGVVMSNRPLRDNELFEIRIDRLVDKWSGSLEIGVTTHNPACVEFPATMTNMRSGTIMMSSSGILTNGRGVRRAYASYNLEELREGSRIGLMRKADGSIHFFINGIDQGAADTQVSGMVWGVVDLYGMVVKVTLIDPNEVRGSVTYAVTNNAPVSTGHSNTNSSNSNSGQVTGINASENRLVSGDNNMADVRLSPLGRVETMERQIHRYLQLFRDLYMEAQIENSQETGPLLFNTRCGCHAAVINSDRTAHRPNAMDDFNNAVVLTNRHLRQGELFEIRLDKVIDKWAGSVEIGVTTHSPLTLDFPSTMTNIRSGTWMMTGTGVMQNGVTVIDEYGCSLDTLRVGDRVGVMRKESGTLHFYVNGLDQGPAATNVPPNVYGVIDLYGQAAQATIIDHTPQESVSRAPVSQDLVFHRSYGHNVLLSNEDRTASRPQSSSESSGTCVLSSRPLADDELFDISIDLLTAGDTDADTLAAGVTLLDTDRQAQRAHSRPNTGHTWMLSGNTVRKDGHELVTQSYGLNLNLAPAGSRLSIVRRADGSLHFLLNNVDHGVAATGIPRGVYAIVDLCGQCSQVTVGPNTGHIVTSSQTDNQLISSTVQQASTISLPLPPEARSHKLHTCCGKNVAFKNDQLTACRVHGHDCGIVFSSQSLHDDELFEVKIDSLSPLYTGGLLIGLTSMSLDDMGQVSLSVTRATELASSCVTWVAMETSVYRNGVVIKYNCLPALSRLVVGSRVGVKRSAEGNMHIVINDTDYGPIVSGLPHEVYAVVDMGGRVEQITVTSPCDSVSRVTHTAHALVTLASADSSCESLKVDEVNSWHTVHGANVELLSGEQSGAVRRVSGFSDALVITKYPLVINKMTCLRLDELDSQWESSVRVGVTSVSADKQRSIKSAISLQQCWLLQASSLLHGSVKVRDNLPVNLDCLNTGDIIGLTLDEEGSIHLSINGIDRGVAILGLPPAQPYYLVADLYGRCRQLSIVSADKPVGGVDSQASPGTGALRKSLDSDSGLKEKINRSKQQMEPQKMRRNCRYLTLCQRARAMLGLPDGYFSAEAGRCYCEVCHKASGDATVVSQGEPCRDYMVPVGWARFALRRQAKAEQLCKKWHTAYHTCLARCVRRVLDTGNLNVADEAAELRPLQPAVSYDEKAEADGEVNVSQGHKMVLLSPVIHCLNSDGPPLQYIDPVTGKQCVADIALQVSVKPGSYKTNTPKKIDALKDKIDARFSKHELEWWTKETGAVVISALLIRVQ